MRARLLVLGAAQHAKVIVSMLHRYAADSYELVGCLDDAPALQGRELLSLPILGPLDELAGTARRLSVAAVAIGVSNRFMTLRARLFDEADMLGLELPTLVHPHASVSPDATLGRGTVLNPGVVVNAFAKIGDNCVCYSNTAVEHETALGANVYVGPGVSFCSNVRVGRDTFVGAGSKIVPDVRIGAGVVVGAGAVVLGDLPDGCTAVGAPARIVPGSGEPFPRPRG